MVSLYPFSFSTTYSSFSPITNTVIIRFRAAGNAPILKKNVYRLTSTHPFSTVLAFLRSQLAYKGPESLVGCMPFPFLSSPSSHVHGAQMFIPLLSVCVCQ